MPKVINDNDVFRAAIDVLASCGYESAATKDIADAAGIHEATLFRKYGSKFNLIEQAIKAQFLDVPLAKVAYTGDLQSDLLAIIEAYLETSEMVGDILPILLIEIPRNSKLKNLLETPWNNIARLINILEQYQAQNILKLEPVLHSISALLGPLMVRHLFKPADQDLPFPSIEPQVYVENFLHGRMT
jgi:AcrR family transcriptional regulator